MQRKTFPLIVSSFPVISSSFGRVSSHLTSKKQRDLQARTFMHGLHLKKAEMNVTQETGKGRYFQK